MAPLSLDELLDQFKDREISKDEVKTHVMLKGNSFGTNPNKRDGGKVTRPHQPGFKCTRKEQTVKIDSSGNPVLCEGQVCVQCPVVGCEICFAWPRKVVEKIPEYSTNVHWSNQTINIHKPWPVVRRWEESGQHSKVDLMLNCRKSIKAHFSQFNGERDRSELGKVHWRAMKKQDHLACYNAPYVVMGDDHRSWHYDRTKRRNKNSEEITTFYI